MPFESIRRIIPKALQEVGIVRQVTAVRLLQEAERTIERWWGPEKARFVEGISFQNGVLKLGIRAPVALQELGIKRIQLQNEVNRALGEKVVQSVLLIRRGF